MEARQFGGAFLEFEVAEEAINLSGSGGGRAAGDWMGRLRYRLRTTSTT